ncbi:MAG TPA: class I SAM-dependent DNA methyltransferase [Pseudomonadota bacterium]|nr:class I SAM-dependent DNA methyltransferase [Pseudomonadota bacterium]
MPLSWNEIKDRALRFSREYAQESSEDAEAKSFWDGFFDVFGISRRRLAAFEKAVEKHGGGRGRIDLFWPGVLMVEHKSRGRDLDRAYAQALDYFPGLPEHSLPRYVLVSDFARFRLHDLDQRTEHEFELKDLHKQVRLFGFMAGYEARSYAEQDPVNVRAAERMGKLHDALKAAGYTGHALEVLLVRLLFCLFADDAGVWNKRQFQDLIELRTAGDGNDVGARLTQLFQVLNTAPSARMRTLDEQLAEFPYVNGKLFEEALPLPEFNAGMRTQLLDACAMDWGSISPAIFGAMFQSVMDAKARRNLGAHYTSEKNIQKLIGPLFLDDLRAEFERIKGNPGKLKDFHVRLANLRFLDPACGCGNFLVITYRELRQLELDVMRAQFAHQQSLFGKVSEHVAVDVDQFYGIEIEEFPAQIAQVALWLMDHQMNVRVSEEFGEHYARLPLVKSANIVCGNALRIDWESVVPKAILSYILGNPPFVGKKEQSRSQKADLIAAFGHARSIGLLDFVTGWYIKAARLASGTAIQCAFVSTNSISQGEQPGVLWPELWSLGVRITFAHRTFRWSNEARGNAAVHCVIVGFASAKRAHLSVFDYADVKGDPQIAIAENINPYLVDGPDVVATKRTMPICPVPKMDFGSKAADFGHLVLDSEERAVLVREYPQTADWVRRFIGSDEFINGTVRYCLWLRDVSGDKLQDVPPVLERLRRVREARLASIDASTRRWAAFPSLFQADRQPSSRYLLVPKVSSERRKYVPLGFCDPDLVVNPSVLVVPDAALLHFGVLSSLMHVAWLRQVGGRMKSDLQYSNTIVYNNFPWPESPTEAQRTAIESAAQGVLDARAAFPTSSLADLYDPLTMPPALVKAHEVLDRAVDAAYGPPKGGFKSDAARVAFLFVLYQKYTSLLPAAKAKRGRKQPGTGRKRSGQLAP